MQRTSFVEIVQRVLTEAALPGVQVDSYHGLIMVAIPKDHLHKLLPGHTISEYVLFDPSTLQSGAVLCRYSSGDPTTPRSISHYEYLIPVENFFSHPTIKAFCIFRQDYVPNHKEPLWLD